MLVVFNTTNKKSKRVFQTIYLLDSQLQILKEKDLVVPTNDKDNLIPTGLTLDEEGSIYYLSGEDLVLLDFFKDYEIWREPLPVDQFESNAYANHISGAFDESGNLIITAGYVTTDVENTKEDKKKSETREGDAQLEGVVYIKVNILNSEVELATISKFTSEFVNEFLNGQLLKMDREPEVNDVFNKFQYGFSDGLTHVVAESVTKSQRGLSFDDIVVFAFESDGSLRWSHRIPRLQVKNPKLSTYGLVTLFEKEDSIFLLFHDDQNNYDESGNRNLMDLQTLFNDSKAVPVFYKINKETGQVDYSMHPDWVSEENLPLNPSYSFASDDGIFIFMKRKKEYQLARISFGED